MSTGVWGLIDITEDGQSVLSDTDGPIEHKLLIRWDRVYTQFTPSEEKRSGYWHIHGHRPEGTLLPHQKGEAPESWTVEVNEDTLIMQGASDSNRGIQRKYARRNDL